MKNILLIAWVIFVFVSCKNNSKENEDVEKIIETEQVHDMHTSQNSLDWQGVYKGVLPCADCEGIEIEITLNDDNTYVIKRLYLGKENNYFQESDTFEWTEDGNNIVLDERVINSPTLFRVGENHLLHLNQEGKIIEGELAEKYVLRKE